MNLYDLTDKATAERLTALEERVKALEGRLGAKKPRPVKEKPPKQAPTLFERFWTAYPSLRKTDKAKCIKAFEIKAQKNAPEVIIKAAEEYAKSPVGQGQYCKGPLTWLNGECWLDDRAAWQRSDSGKQVKKMYLSENENFLDRRTFEQWTAVAMQFGKDGQHEKYSATIAERDRRFPDGGKNWNEP